MLDFSIANLRDCENITDAGLASLAAGCGCLTSVQRTYATVKISRMQDWLVCLQDVKA